LALKWQAVPAGWPAGRGAKGRGMKLGFIKGTVVGVVVAMACLAATSALAGTGVGAVFNLGRTNTVNATSGLKGSQKGSMLAVTNTGRGPALSLRVGKGRAPLAVSSSVRVQHLNASLLDGRDAGAFTLGGGQSRSFGFLEAVGLSGKLLSIPGFGSLKAMCFANEGAEIEFDGGSHPVDMFAAEQASDSSPAQVIRKALPASTGFVFTIAGGNASVRSDQLLLRYGTVSSPSSRVTEHVAAINVFYALIDQDTCDFTATMTASSGFRSP
jgi:hypothetical protein